MKMIIDIMELYKNVAEIPTLNPSTTRFDESAIIQQAEKLVGEYFPAYDGELLVKNGQIVYTVSFDYFSVPDKVIFEVIPIYK